MSDDKTGQAAVTWQYSVNVGPTKALILEPDGSTIMELLNVARDGEFERKVRRICRSVNCHEGLVKALEEARHFIVASGVQHPGGIVAIIDKALYPRAKEQMP